jgi:hypothetical protein
MVSGPVPANVTPVAGNTSTGMTYNQVENVWIQAGGNPQAAAMAAAVADASSGLNPNAQNNNPDGSTSRGLWQISSVLGALSTKDPLANARAAIQMSNNGSDWSGWCSTWSDNNCGINKGTYLGDGANALASLAGRLGTGSYNVAGAAPSGAGYSGSGTIANAAGTPAASTGSNKLLLVAGLLAVIGIVIYAAKQRRSTSVAPTGPPIARQP